MGDFANLLVREGRRGCLNPMGAGTPLGDVMPTSGAAANQTGTWTANRAVYLPVLVQRPLTVTDILITVATQNGNVDAGIYDWAGTRLVSNGGVACGAAGVQSIAIADTALSQGWHYIAFASDSSTAAFQNTTFPANVLRILGGRQQSSAYPLPDPATFATYATSVTPQIVAAYSSTL